MNKEMLPPDERIVRLDGLYAPRSYWEAPKLEREEISNGCGPAGKGYLVPDTFWGLDISEACDIHDWMYHKGDSSWDKLMADLFMFLNCVLIIDRDSKTLIMKILRTYRAASYFNAVHHGGDEAFWAGKHKAKMDSFIDSIS